MLTVSRKFSVGVRRGFVWEDPDAVLANRTTLDLNHLFDSNVTVWRRRVPGGGALALFQATDACFQAGSLFRVDIAGLEQGWCLYNDTHSFTNSHTVRPCSHIAPITTRYKGRVLPLYLAFSYMFQHVTQDIMPMLGELMEFLDNNPDVKVAMYRHPWLERMLPKERIVNPHGGPLSSENWSRICADTLLFPSSLPLGGFELAGTFHGSHVAHRCLMGHDDLPYAKRDVAVYLSRKGGRLGRDVYEEGRVIQEIRDWLKVNRPDLTLFVFGQKHEQDELFTVFQRAALVIGAHGGAFGNLLLAPADNFTVVLEIKNSGFNWQRFAENLGHSYYTLELPVAHTADLGKSAAIIIPPGLLSARLDEILLGGWTLPMMGAVNQESEGMNKSLVELGEERRSTRYEQPEFFFTDEHNEGPPTLRSEGGCVCTAPHWLVRKH